MDINRIQAALRQYGVDGWLFYDFRGSDPIATRILELDVKRLLTRRWFYLIPASGEPVKLVHRIEMDALDSLPGRKLVYLSWQQLESHLKGMLSGLHSVAMQYSPKNAVPYVSRVDAGTIELVRASGVRVVSSGDLVQLFESTWTDEQLAMHLRAAEALRRIVLEAFAEIARRISACRVETSRAVYERCTEYDIQQFICDRYKLNGLVSKSPPIVAVNDNASRPHYLPTETSHREIRRGDLVLLDIWAKLDAPNSVYADITWVGYVGEKVPERYAKVFDLVRGARDAAYEFVSEAVRKGRRIRGWQVDDVARNYIRERGYGDYFIHRTGHNIGLEVHGNGANIDNLETREERTLVPRTAFSIEPGIYLPEFGIRSEIDVYLSESEAVISGQPIQTEIVPIL